MIQRDHYAEGSMQRGAVIFKRNDGSHGSSRKSREAHGAGHRLRERIEAEAVCVGSIWSERGNPGEDDAGVQRFQGIVVDLHLLHYRDRKVRDHDIGRLHQAADNFGGLGL